MHTEKAESISSEIQHMHLSNNLRVAVFVALVGKHLNL